MKITKETYVSDILREYGDIAELMELFGIRRVRGYFIRRILARFITVKIASFVHGVPLNIFIRMIENAIDQKEAANSLSFKA